MDVINFPAMIALHGLLKSDKIKQNHDLIVIGKKVSKKKRDGSQYEEMAMTIAEFLKLVAEDNEFCTINLTASADIRTAVNFSHPSGTGNAIVDVIDNNLHITRNLSGWLYNPLYEASSNNLTPTNTEWAVFLGDATQIKNYTYDTLENVVIAAYGSFNLIPGNTLAMHDTLNDKYYLFEFISWGSGGSNGEFTYNRSLVENICDGCLHFPDGTTLCTAPSAGSSSVPATNYYVDAVLGNDGTALANRFDLPYQTLQGAYAAATLAAVPALVYCRSGAYNIGVDLKDGIDIYFEPGCTSNAGAIVLNDANATVKVYGYLEVSPGCTLELATTATGSDFTFECESWNSSANAAIYAGPTALGYLRFRCNVFLGTQITSNGRIFQIDNVADVTLDVRNYIRVNRALVYFRNTPTGANMVINTPKIYMSGSPLVAAIYQNYLINVQPGTNCNLTINANIEYEGATPANQSIMILWAGDLTSVLTINGNVYAGGLIGIENRGAFNLNGDITSDSVCIFHASTSPAIIKNGKIKSSGVAESTQGFTQNIVLGATPLYDSADSKIYMKNCVLENTSETNAGLIMLDRDGGGINRNGQAYFYDCEAYNKNLEGVLANDGVVTANRIGAISISVAGAGLTNGTYYDIAPTNIVGTGSGTTFDVVVSGGVITKVVPKERGNGYQLADTFDFSVAIGGAHTEVIQVDGVHTSMVGMKDLMSNVDHKGTVGDLFLSYDFLIDQNLQILP